MNDQTIVEQINHELAYAGSAAECVATIRKLLGGPPADSALVAEVTRLREALDDILRQHDGNQSPAMNMPDLDYARMVIRSIHYTARTALNQQKASNDA